jgi:hypothetical protein
MTMSCPAATELYPVITDDGGETTLRLVRQENWPGAKDGVGAFLGRRLTHCAANALKPVRDPGPDAV